jgi:hypothetical protein
MHLVVGWSRAVPVVDLGTAERERAVEGRLDNSFNVGVAPGGESSAGHGDVLWAIWGYVH